MTGIKTPRRYLFKVIFFTCLAIRILRVFIYLRLYHLKSSKDSFNFTVITSFLNFLTLSSYYLWLGCISITIVTVYFID